MLEEGAQTPVPSNAPSNNDSVSDDWLTYFNENIPM